LNSPARTTSDALECGFCWDCMGNRRLHQEWSPAKAMDGGAWHWKGSAPRLLLAGPVFPPGLFGDCFAAL